jgi:hypothetical protein
MECKFYIGQKVVCITDELGLFMAPGSRARRSLDGLKAGQVYTISSILSVNGPNYTTRVQVVLKEIQRPGEVKGYDYRRFKPLDEIREELRKKTEVKRKTDISVFQDMCKKVYTPQEIAELLEDEEKI